MARVNIEEEAWKRIYRLADLVGCDVREAAGTVACLWNFSQDLVRTHGTKEEILDWANLFKIPAEKSAVWLKGLEKARFISSEKNSEYKIHGNKIQIETRASFSKRGSKGAKALREKVRSLARAKPEPSPGNAEAKPVASPLITRQDKALQSNTEQGNADQNITAQDFEKYAKAKKPDKNAAAFIGAYCARFKKRWGFNPQIVGKDSGIAKRIAKDLSPTKFDVLLDAFFQMPDAGLIKAKHPLNFFEMRLNEISVFANSGEFTTKTQANQQDSSVSNAMLLQKVREGKL